MPQNTFSSRIFSVNNITLSHTSLCFKLSSNVLFPFEIAPSMTIIAIEENYESGISESLHINLQIFFMI